MNAFHRTKRDSRWLSAIGLSIAFLLSLVFMLVGFIDLENESGFYLLRVIFGVVGICLFVLFMRGCWIATSGALIHVFSMDEDELEWGFVGREKRIALSEIAKIYWDDTDGFTFVVHLTDGKRIRFPYLQNVVSYQSRGELLAFLRSNFPAIPISGSIDAKTKQAADRSS
jgi:hypothetical protein